VSHLQKQDEREGELSKVDNYNVLHFMPSRFDPAQGE
jgi:hypothetical protein